MCCSPHFAVVGSFARLGAREGTALRVVPLRTATR